MPLTQRQQAFVTHYLGDAEGNATRAAELAGYAHPNVACARLLANVSVKEAIEAHNAELRTHGIRAKANRLNDYQAFANRLAIILDERAAEWEEVEADQAIDDAFRRSDVNPLGTFGRRRYAPGGRSGFLVRTLKQVGQGKYATVTEEVAFDKALFDAMLKVRQQAAQELGDWTEKRQITGANEGPIKVEAVDAAAEKLFALLAEDETEGGAETDCCEAEIV